jgi:hypothetical protein
MVWAMQGLRIGPTIQVNGNNLFSTNFTIVTNSDTDKQKGTPVHVYLSAVIVILHFTCIKEFTDIFSL